MKPHEFVPISAVQGHLCGVFINDNERCGFPSSHDIHMPSVSALVDALEECLGFVESDYAGSGDRDLSNGAIGRARAALAQWKGDR